MVVQDEDENKDIFVITQSNFDESALGNDYKLITFDNVASENEKVADAIIDDDGDVIIKAFTRGKVRIGIDFTYLDRSKTCHEATWVGVFRVQAGNEIVFEESGFVDGEDNDNNSSNNEGSGSVLKDVIGGIGAFAGAFFGGLAGTLGDDDDY